MGGVGKLMCVDLWLVQGEGCRGQGGGREVRGREGKDRNVKGREG